MIRSRVCFVLIGLLMFGVARSESTTQKESLAHGLQVGDQELIHLFHDEPMYFLMGSPNTKAQLSFKAKILSSSDLYVAYTQKIFWDLFKESRPFRDVNYHPSLFYRLRIGALAHSESDHTYLDFIPYDHESNGKAAKVSRSWDRISAKFQRAFIANNGLWWAWSVRAWIPYNCEATNPDLMKYRGLYEVAITLSHFMGTYFKLNDLTLRFYSGGDLWVQPWGGGRELTLRLRGDSTAFLANAVFQVFQGFGESLLDYNQNYFGVRAGFGI